MVTASYTEARAHLAELLDKVLDDREMVTITRRGRGSVTLIATDELESILETLHVFRSPANAERLLAATARAEAREGTPSDLATLKLQVGLCDE